MSEEWRLVVDTRAFWERAEFWVAIVQAVAGLLALAVPFVLFWRKGKHDERKAAARELAHCAALTPTLRIWLGELQKLKYAFNTSQIVSDDWATRTKRSLDAIGQTDNEAPVGEIRSSLPALRGAIAQHLGAALTESAFLKWHSVEKEGLLTANFSPHDVNAGKQFWTLDAHLSDLIGHLINAIDAIEQNHPELALPDLPD